MIEFRDIHKTFGTKRVLQGVTIDVGTGRVLYIIGSSGVGKSVLVKQLVGLGRPDSGRILLDEEDVTDLDERGFFAVRKKCAMVFQHSTLFDSMSVLENVALPIRKHFRVGRRKAQEMAHERLDQVRMGHAAHRRPAELGSGFQKQVAIARALTLEPEYVIFDEPTTALDPAAALHVDELIRSLRRDAGVTAIVVSHDLRSIFGVADRIAMLYQGRIRLDGTPDDFRRSEDPVVHQFIRGLPDGPMKV